MDSQKLNYTCSKDCEICGVRAATHKIGYGIYRIYHCIYCKPVSTNEVIEVSIKTECLKCEVVFKARSKFNKICPTCKCRSVFIQEDYCPEVGVNYGY